MKSNKYAIISALFFLLTSVIGCRKMDYNYKEFIKDGEIIYSTKIDSVTFSPGDNRLQIKGFLKNAIQVKKILIKWEKPDRTPVIKEIAYDYNADPDSFLTTFDIPEGQYLFNFTTINSGGNGSIPFEKATKIYGDAFKSNLTNRPVISVVTNEDGSVTVTFGAVPDNMVITKINYKSTIDGNTNTVKVKSDESIVNLENVDLSVSGSYTSGYLPEKNALDTLYAASSELILPKANVYVGNYHSTGTFNHPSTGIRNFELDKTLMLIDENTCETDHSDLGSGGYKIRLKVNADNTVTVTQYNGSGAEIGEMVPDAVNTYNPTTKTFTLNYRYSGSGGYRAISETLVKK